MSKIVRVQRTSLACPSQWDAWDEDGNYLYLRYRHGVGTAERHASEAEFYVAAPGTGRIAQFEFGGEYDGDIDLEAFCDLAGLELAEDVQYITYGEWLRAELEKELNS